MYNNFIFNKAAKDKHEYKHTHKHTKNSFIKKKKNIKAKYNKMAQK